LALMYVWLLYSAVSPLVYPACVTILVLAFLDLFDTLLAELMYVEYWLLYSECRRQDLKLAWILLAFPGFTFLTRCWNAISTLNELLGKSHLESAMAPSWVLRRTKF